MSDLKPLGSEKLNGDDKLKRILELAYYKNNNKSSSTKAELVKESKTGGVFGIVKEKDGYYVKRGLNESSLDYIGGIFMKNKNKFSSYSEALKRLSLIKGQEELQEATKYVLKPQSSAPQQEAPMADPSMDAAPAPEMNSDLPTDMPPAEETPMDASSELPSGDTTGVDNGEPKRSDYMAEIQKYAGKLGQELRDQHQKMESDDIKYVLNMIISAVDLDKLDLEDLEEIGKKFERDEEGELGGEDMGSEEPTGEEVPAEEPAAPAPSSADKEMGENMDALERFVNGPAPMDEISLDDYLKNEESLDGQHDENYEDHGQMGEDDLKEVDLEEIKNEINNHIHSTLKKYFN